MIEKSKYFELLAVAVAGGSTITAAAKTVCCSESHAYRICSEASFKSRVAAIRSDITAQAVGKLTQATTLAVNTLIELLGPASEPAIRLNASKAILATVAPMSEFGELRSRLDALESRKLRIAK